MKKFHLLTAIGVITKGDLKERIDWFIKNGTLSDEFPEFKGENISKIRPVGEDNDGDTVVDLLNLGWPICLLTVSDKEFYAIPLSFRERVDKNTLDIMKLN